MEIALGNFFIIIIIIIIILLDASTNLTIAIYCLSSTS